VDHRSALRPLFFCPNVSKLSIRRKQETKVWRECQKKGIYRVVSQGIDITDTSIGLV
jgi:hypothetical protein